MEEVSSKKLRGISATSQSDIEKPSSSSDPCGPPANRTTIEDLPLEILGLIFFLLVQQWHTASLSRFSRSWYPILRVNKRWRTLAEGTHDLWSHIPLRTANSEGELGTLLRLSTPLPLHVFMVAETGDEPDVLRVHMQVGLNSGPLVSSKNRITSLELQMDHVNDVTVLHHGESAQTLPDAFPALRHLALRTTAHSSRTQNPVSAFGLDAVLRNAPPLLTCLDLVFRAPYKIETLPGSLRDLRLEGPTCNQEFENNIITLCGTLLHLETLSLSGFYAQRSPTPLSKPVELSELRYLSLHAPESGDVEALLSQVTYPPLTNLTIVFPVASDTQVAQCEELMSTVRWLCQEVESDVTDSLVVNVNSKHFMVTWCRDWSDGCEPMVIVLKLELPANDTFTNGYNDIIVLQTRLCRAFTLPNLQRVSVSLHGLASGWRWQDWAHAFGSPELTRLEQLSLETIWIRPLVSAMTGTTVQEEQTQSLFPALHHLIVKDAMFEASKGNGTDWWLFDMLKDRRERSVGIQKLEFDSCFGLTKDDESVLKGLVDTVVCHRMETKEKHLILS
ncbi:hypothetical protein DL96DRAFT_1035651 [Flagelloscypha sp. PMI_526]|nr:hypothetical protein DL96DRAFT_1035651 [Flagelloscypha sp. PMI_526]